MTSDEVLAQIWAQTGLDATALRAVALSGTGPGLPSSFCVGAAAAGSIAASGLAAAALWKLRTGRQQEVAVDLRHACAEFRSEHLASVDGAPAPARWDDIAGLYPTRGGGGARLHTNFPHHREGVIRLLGCAGSWQAVAAAMLERDAVTFETEAAEAGLAVSAMRSFAQWDAHPQGQAVRTQDLIAITRIGDAPPQKLPDGPRPLSGIRVLELVRVIAGPVGGRTLAAHGAEVMNITAAHLPSVETLDVNRGKLSAQLDLRESPGRVALEQLIAQSHIFVQGYRPGAVAGLGFGPERAAALRPGLVYATLSAYGPAGPWSGRHGFDSLVQTASGFNAAEAEAFGQAAPRPLPAQALDHATGYLLATGVMAALHRSATIGGSWHVEVSLARTAHWLRGLGRCADGLEAPAQTEADIADLFEVTASPFGTVRALRHAAMLSETPTYWTLPSVPLGTHAASWPA
jgi:crotonobetainyl-CoA:carnitine CoA-transferase CaiB-like acyl-CoA transferase